ncbi:MAG: TIGR01777 family oxidoreductase [Bacteroidales bacterium]|nr:TIGR01777 family oxidoreductase [Bacteroidales bacterium]
MKIIISGGTGFIGSKLSEKLEKEGFTLAIISRQAEIIDSRFTALSWDENEILSFIGKEKFAVINLAGRSISSGRWTNKNKQKIVQSRIFTIDFFGKIFKNNNLYPEVFIQASAIGFYGTHKEKIFTEKEANGDGFLADLAYKIEKAVEEKIESKRKILIRTGLVAGKNGGFLKRLLLPYKFFAGGHFGTGKQFFSWIHIEDEIDAILFLLRNENTKGAYNLTAPEPVSMKEFCKTTGKVLKRPSFMVVPGFILRIIFGEMAKEVLLSGQKVIPQRLMEEGFIFSFPNLNSALSNLLKN